MRECITAVAASRESAPFGTEHEHDWLVDERESSTDCSPRSSRPTLQTAGALEERGIPATVAIGTYSIALAAAFTTAGVSAHCDGAYDHTGDTAVSADLSTAEVARIGHTVERDEERGRRAEQVVYVGRGNGAARASTPCGASLRHPGERSGGTVSSRFPASSMIRRRPSDSTLREVDGSHRAAARPQ